MDPTIEVRDGRPLVARSSTALNPPMEFVVFGGGHERKIDDGDG
jgi:hypothetical protein